MTAKINITANIIPAKSIGNIEQGGMIRDYLEQSIEFKYLIKISTFNDNIRFIEYEYNNSIKITVDIFYGRISRIIAFNDYIGKMNDEFYIGMKLREVLKIDSSFQCYSTGGLMSLNYLGICLYFTESFDADIDNLTPYLENKILGIGLISQLNEFGNDNYLDIYGQEYWDILK